nr:acyltransferase [uncultured Rhodococcus sp.]
MNDSSVATIATRFDPRHNSLNALRLVMASLVIVSHSWLLGGFGNEPSLGGNTLGTWAVIGFFSLSGFLITRSRLSPKSTADFYRDRFLRIYPGFLVCLLVVAFVLAPIAANIQSTAYRVRESITYVIRDLPLYTPKIWQRDIGATLTGNPYPDIWNGPLWTLFWEAICYVMIGVLVSVVSRRFVPYVMVAIFLVATVAQLAAVSGVVHWPDRFDAAIPLFTAFSAGALMFLFAYRIPVGVIPTVIAVAVLASVILAGAASALAAFPVSFLLLQLGRHLPLSKVGSVNDISYGIYIYGWPVQQMLIVLLPGLPVAAFALLSLTATTPLAIASWFFVEKNALRFKSRPPGKSMGATSA